MGYVHNCSPSKSSDDFKKLTRSKATNVWMTQHPNWFILGGFQLKVRFLVGCQYLNKNANWYRKKTESKNTNIYSTSHKISSFSRKGLFIDWLILLSSQVFLNIFPIVPSSSNKMKFQLKCVFLHVRFPFQIIEIIVLL